MSEISAERKLQVVRQIREEHANNQRLIQGREHILYGFHSPYPAYSKDALYTDSDSETFPLPRKNISLKIRFFVALILLVSLILLDRADISFYSYSLPDMVTYLETDITKDFQTNLFDFTSVIPYTTK